MDSEYIVFYCISLQYIVAIFYIVRPDFFITSHLAPVVGPDFFITSYFVHLKPPLSHYNGTMAVTLQ